MTKAGDCFVSLCVHLYDIPAASMCVILFLIQAGIMNYYLVVHLSYEHLTWIAFDLANLCLLISCMYQSHINRIKEKTQEITTYSFAWVSWLIMNTVLAVKTILFFLEVAVELEEEHPTFFGPNTLKTTIALGSCIFLLLLTTQHDAPLGSERRRYIDELTGTVVFDLLDTADVLETLFEREIIKTFWTGLKEFILAVATLNLVIPTVPLLTLSRTKFGRDKLQKRLVYLHRMLVVLAVNVPNLVVRLNLWHAYSVAISPFTLKNIILIFITVYEFYLHKKGKYLEHKIERSDNKNNNQRSIEPGLSTEKNSETTCHVISNNYDNNIQDFALEQRAITHL